MKIGIGITTHNRPEIFKQTYAKIKEFLPPGAVLVVVDDCSNIPIKEATFRFNKNVGIATSKNACFAMVEDCDYIFLFDDDCFPIVMDWHLPYINSGFNHLCFTFDKTADRKENGNRLITRANGYNIYKTGCGCMLFYTKKCLEIVGGMDEEYGIWSHEHIGLSLRIHNNGLTPYPFMDVASSKNLFYSHDYHMSCERSVSPKTRKEELARNTPKLQAEIKSKEFIPYRKMTGRVITTYFTGFEDPQRGKRWVSNLDDTKELTRSIYEKGQKLTVLTDSLFQSDKIPNGLTVEMAPVLYKYAECTINPYLQRWISILQYLKEVKEDYVFCVDATDVIMLNNPFEENVGNYLWLGDEKDTISSAWLQKHHNAPLFQDFFKSHKNAPLLNAGLVGGRKHVVEAFLREMVNCFTKNDVGMSDMAAFNFIAYTQFSDIIRHGPVVNTPFKSYSKTGASWWAHK